MGGAGYCRRPSGRASHNVIQPRGQEGDVRSGRGADTLGSATALVRCGGRPAGRIVRGKRYERGRRTSTSLGGRGGACPAGRFAIHRSRACTHGRSARDSRQCPERADSDSRSSVGQRSRAARSPLCIHIPSHPGGCNMEARGCHRRRLPPGFARLSAACFFDRAGSARMVGSAGASPARTMHWELDAAGLRHAALLSDFRCPVLSP